MNTKLTWLFAAAAPPQSPRLRLGQMSLRSALIRMSVIAACLTPLTYGSLIASGLLLLMLAPVVLFPRDRLCWLMSSANLALGAAVYVRSLF